MIDLIRELFERHHESLRMHFDQRIDALQQEIRTMSETNDQAFASISAKVDKLATDLAADLAVIKAGQLSAEQQAAVKSIEDRLDAMDATVTQPAPAPAA